jgi:F-type H+-transporting ATPase subunit beta
MRGLDCVDTGKPVSVPVGTATLGRVFNVLGEAIDQRGDVKGSMIVGLFTAKLPRFLNFPPTRKSSKPVLRLLTLLTPFVRGGKAGLFGGAGLGQDGYS